MDKNNIAAVILAGGRSSRMGTDKALLDYKGRPLIQYMTKLLKEAGFLHLYTSGRDAGVGYIPDQIPYEGPGPAMADCLECLSAFRGVLFVPVDMPLLTPNMLDFLVGQEVGGYFLQYPLPAFIQTTFLAPNKPCYSVRDVLTAYQVPAWPLPQAWEPLMMNVNTPDMWEEALSA